MRIFKTRLFHKWTEKIKLNDLSILNAIDQMQQGQYEASLGGYLYKKRIAIGNKGKRGGARTIIAFRKNDKAFFVYGYAKNSMSNITENELVALKDLANIYFSYDDKQIEVAIKNNKFIEVINNE